MPPLKTTVEIDGADGSLICPRCESRFLHHLGVTIFNRSEDEETEIKFSVSGDAVRTEVVNANYSDNPSRRRHGLAIQFSCENCSSESDGVVLELTLAQHKGCSLVEWRHSRLS